MNTFADNLREKPANDCTITHHGLPSEIQNYSKHQLDKVFVVFFTAMVICIYKEVVWFYLVKRVMQYKSRATIV